MLNLTLVVFQEAADPAPAKVGIVEAIFGTFGPEDALAVVWLVLSLAGTVAGLATIANARWGWPPTLLRWLIAAGVVALALFTALHGLPPLLFDDAPEEPAFWAGAIQLQVLHLFQWLALVAGSGFALSVRAARRKEWWRFAGYLLLIAPIVTAGQYGRGTYDDMAKGWPSTPEQEAFLNSFFRNQYLIGCGALAAAIVLLLLLDQMQRRAAPHHGQSPA